MYKLKVKLVKSLIWTNVLRKAFEFKLNFFDYSMLMCEERLTAQLNGEERRGFAFRKEDFFAMRNEDVMYLK